MLLPSLQNSFSTLLLALCSAALLSASSAHALAHPSVDKAQARAHDADALGAQAPSRLVKRFTPAPSASPAPAPFQRSESGRRNLLSGALPLPPHERADGGVATVPLFAREGASKTQGRRAVDVRKREPALIEMKPDANGRYGATMTIAGEEQTILLQIGNPVTGIVNQAQVSSSVDLPNSQAATATGATISNPAGTEFSATLQLGSVQLEGFGFNYLDVDEHLSAEYANGYLGLGLPGAVDADGELAQGATLPGLLQTLLDDGGKTVPAPIMTITLAGDVGELGVGGVPSAYKDPFYQPAARPNEWNVQGSFDGVDFEADLLPFVIDGMIGTTDTVTAFFKKQGIEVRPSTKEEYDGEYVVADVDCKNPPQLQFELPGGTVTFDGPGAAFKTDAGGCISLIRGQEQGEYPVPFSLGTAFVEQAGLILDYTDGNPRIGFVPS